MEEADEDFDLQKHFAANDLNQIKNQYGVLGYRDGVTEGQEKVLQPSFEDGFSEGVTLGYPLGQLRGMLSTLLTFYEAHPDLIETGQTIEEIQSLHEEILNFDHKSENFASMMMEEKDDDENSLDNFKTRIFELIRKHGLEVQD